jgi:hypothetical protein
MAKRRSTLDAFAPVRTAQPEPGPSPEAEPAPSSPVAVGERPAPQTPAAPRKPEPEAASVSSILDRIAKQIPQPQGEVRRLTVYLPPSVYDHLTEVWAGIRKRTGIKVGKASLALAALEAVLESPELVERMVLRATEQRLG